MLKIVIGLVLIAHGIGHSMGMLKVFGLATVNPDWDGSSWILSGVAGSTITNAIGMVLWAAALVGFVAAGLVVLGVLPEEWWVPLAIASSIASLAGVVLFPVAFPVFSTVGAAVIDVAVLVAVLWAGWSPSDLAA
jgi:hypothetical protein